MASQPYLRTADDGTYELVVPAGMGRVHILPYCFHTEEDAMKWLSTRKGREQINKISGRNQPRFVMEHADSLA
jgi:hypothetical protein